jgi:Arc/MetJ-type ribon-helix-helix transcriptional regulator
MASNPQTTTLETEVPPRLWGEMRSLVEAGWFRNLDELVLEALRRYVETHREDLMEEMIREDVAWGLRGGD